MTTQDPQYAPLERSPRLSDLVAEQMLEDILRRGLRGGDRLPSERELGERFDVSRTVIREATRTLSARGIIESRPGAGLRVASLGTESVSEPLSLLLRTSRTLGYQQIHEVRNALEVECAGLAAERFTAEHRGVLTKLVDQQASEQDPETASRIDVEFHRWVAQLTQNELFVVMHDSIRDTLMDVRRVSMTERPEGREVAIDAHRAIATAIEAGDRSAARTAMHEHLEEARASWAALGLSLADRESP